MKFMSFALDGKPGLAVETGDGFRGLMADAAGYPGDLGTLIAKGDAAVKRAGETLAKGERIDPDAVAFLPPLAARPRSSASASTTPTTPPRAAYKQPSYPTLFGRFATSLVATTRRSSGRTVSEQLDYEGELVAVIGRGGRHIAKAAALDHVAGYSIFNDGSVRDYQFKAPQWTVGKNFDGTGAFGPVFVTADELPPGAQGPAARDAAERRGRAERRTPTT